MKRRSLYLPLLLLLIAACDVPEFTTPDLGGSGGGPPLVHIVPVSVVIGVDSLVQLQAYRVGVDTAPFEWRSADAAIARVDSTGQVTRVAVGRTEIRAWNGLVGPATSRVEVR